MLVANLPFIVHGLIETFAGFAFVFDPEGQLAKPDLATTLVIQSYGGGILSSALIAFVFASRELFDRTSQLVAVSFAFWHIWPCYRAAVRISSGADLQTKQAKTMGGPTTHLAVHAILTAMFLYSATLGNSASTVPRG